MKRAVLQMIGLGLAVIRTLNSFAAPATKGDEYWDSRFSLPGLDGPVSALATDGTNLYACGTFRFAGPLRVNGVARWDGTNWWSLGEGLGPFSSPVAIAVNSGNVYVGGYFTSVSGVRAT